MISNVCKDCPYRQAPINGEGEKGAKVMVIGDSPISSDVWAKRPFASRGGQLLRQLMEHVGIKLSDCYFTYLTCCYEVPFSNFCLDHIKEKVMEINPEVIVCIGADVARKLMPDFKKSNRDNGKIFNTIFGIPGLATIHPATILKYKGTSNFPTLKNDLIKIWQRIYGFKDKYHNPTTVWKEVTQDTISEVLQQINQEAKVIAYDWETNGVDTKKARGYYLGLSWKIGHAVCVPINIINKYKVEFVKLFSRKDITFVAFNGMFDMKINRNEGLPEVLDFDPMLMHYLLDERPQPRNLENLAILFCGAEPYETIMLNQYECNKNEIMDKIPTENIIEYCCRDADYTLRLYHIFYEQLEREPKLLKLYKLLLNPAAHMLSDIQEYGFFVDTNHLAVVTKEMEVKVQNLKQKLVDIVGRNTFNPNSPQQVAEYLWDVLKLPEPQLTGRSERSVDKDTRKALLEAHPGHPFVTALDEYKESYILLSRYLYKIPESIGKDGRLRSQYYLDRTETGRLATTNFPIHQMPRNSNVRGVLCAPPGFALIQADYAQVEMRMAAHLANDLQFNDKIFKADVDFHSKMAAEAYKIPVDKVTKAQRQAAKSVSFGLLYLMSDAGLAKSTGLSKKDAAEFVANYKKIMPGVMKWIEDIKKQVVNQRYVESLFGRRRRFPFVLQGKFGNLSELQREAVNMPIQSSASDLTLWQAVKLHNIFKTKYKDVRVLTLVHDSIVVECPNDLVEEIYNLMKVEMEKPPFKTNVRFKVDVKVGQRWGEEQSLEEWKNNLKN